MTFLQFTQTVYAVLLSFAPWHGDVETQAQREARLGIAATSIAIASDQNIERAIALMVQAKSETNLARHVHRGECGPNDCDAAWVRTHGGRLRVFRARNLWQVHSAPRADLRELWLGSLGDGLAQTTNAARLADYYLRARRCGGNLAQMYSAQGGRGCVEAPSGLRRAALHRKLREQWRVVAKEAR
jgi:hypothetical protein